MRQTLNKIEVSSEYAAGNAFGTISLVHTQPVFLQTFPFVGCSSETTWRICLRKCSARGRETASNATGHPGEHLAHLPAVDRDGNSLCRTHRLELLRSGKQSGRFRRCK